jgi:hypothetical protein
MEGVQGEPEIRQGLSDKGRPLLGGTPMKNWKPVRKIVAAGVAAAVVYVARRLGLDLGSSEVNDVVEVVVPVVVGYLVKAEKAVEKAV